jgi:hypothetical protein
MQFVRGSDVKDLRVRVETDLTAAFCGGRKNEIEFSPISQEFDRAFAFPRLIMLRQYGIVFVSVLLLAALALATPKPEEVPTFTLRVRVVSVAGLAPGDRKFSVRLQAATTTAQGSAWSAWVAYDIAGAAKTVATYPAMRIKSWPIVLVATIGGVSDPTIVQAELKFDETGEVIPLQWELFGPRMGIILWRDDNHHPGAATMAQYNRRYWKAAGDESVPPNLRPKKFVLSDRFIGGDDDRVDWGEGIDNLARAGFTALSVPRRAEVVDLLRKTGQYMHTAWGVYSPPGYAFATPLPGKKTPQACSTWATAQAKPHLSVGFAPTDMAIFAMADEPGWYYPSAYQMLQDPDAAARFHNYLKLNGLTPSDMGSTDWNSVKPLGRSSAQDLPTKRLFYWTQRFFTWDSANYFAECTRELEKAFYPGIPVYTNWNNFAGRMYVPGPIANNQDKQSTDAAIGGHDWLEFGRLRGSTALWTEDWFADAQAYQWSFYAAKLRSAAEKGGVSFGGYVIPRASGDREDGLLQKILTLIGSGGKAVDTFVFGPEYEFPGNCYSENPQILRKLAHAYTLVGASEDVLWPGRRPPAQVAILSPRSSEMWDEKDVPLPAQIHDGTNTNAGTVDYMAEVADLYLALQHANIPVDFVEEGDLSPAGLARYRIVYVTEPDIPVEDQRGPYGVGAEGWNAGRNLQCRSDGPVR